MRCKSLLFVFASILTLSACASSSGGSGWGSPQGQGTYVPPENAAPAIQPQSTPIRLALLVPMSGPSASLGEAMLNAAQLALVDLGAQNIDLVPKDTGTTPTQASVAAQEALREDVQAILGPVFADATRRVGADASGHNVPVLSFSTDSSVAGGQVLVMGILPELQAIRMAEYAAAQGIKNFGVIVGQDEYGRLVGDAFVARARSLGVRVTQVLRLPQDPATSAQAVSAFVQNPQNQNVQAVFMPLPTQTARAVADTLSRAGATPDRMRRMGTGLWDDAGIENWPALRGAWFAAPDPASRTRFEQKYAATYGATPPRLASLAYDATALMITAGRTGPITPQNLRNPNGFLGTDGIFRFRSNGVIDRGLAVLEASNGRVLIADPAPRQFTAPGR